MDTAAVKARFKQTFGYTPAHFAHAPGRLELLGTHTAHHDGLVLAAAVNRHASLAAAPRTDGKIELVAPECSARELFWISDLKKNPATPWADPIKTLLTELRRRGVPFSGFNAALHSEIPAGVGLGRTAALQLAAALVIRQLFPFRLTETGTTMPPRRDGRGRLPPLPPPERLALARLCHSAGRELNPNRTLADYLPGLFGKAWHVLCLDCQFWSIHHAPLIGETLVVCDSGVRHPTTLGRVAEVRHFGTAAAAALGVRSLRAVEVSWLKANQARLAGRELACARHLVGEIQRGAFAERALRDDDHAQFGQYLFQSHESARGNLGNSCAELDRLVELARALPACLGAGLSGPGFGGATVNLVRHHQVEDFMTTIAAQHQGRTERTRSPLLCQIVDAPE